MIVCLTDVLFMLPLGTKLVHRKRKVSGGFVKNGENSWTVTNSSKLKGERAVILQKKIKNEIDKKRRIHTVE